MATNVEGLDDFERDLQRAVPSLTDHVKTLDSRLSSTIVADARKRPIGVVSSTDVLAAVARTEARA